MSMICNDRLFLDRAVDLADQMLFAFDSPTGMPYGIVSPTHTFGYW
jgi:hypothetical protein